MFPPLVGLRRLPWTIIQSSRVEWLILRQNCSPRSVPYRNASSANDNDSSHGIYLVGRPSNQLSGCRQILVRIENPVDTVLDCHTSQNLASSPRQMARESKYRQTCVHNRKSPIHREVRITGRTGRPGGARSASEGVTEAPRSEGDSWVGWPTPDSFSSVAGGREGKLGNEMLARPARCADGPGTRMKLGIVSIWGRLVSLTRPTKGGRDAA